jgi:hypothetical protein
MNYMPVKGYHRLKNGNSSMDIRLFALYQVQHASGPQMAVSETVTFFNDMCCMAPAALIDNRIKWLETYDDKVKASFTQDDITVTAWLYFNQKGELIDFTSYDRYAEANDGSLQQMKWSTPLRDYKDIHNHRLPSYAETIYTYVDGDFTYATFAVTNVQYNVTK